jgi:hypothetical protein
MRELSLDLIYRVWDTYLAEIGGTDDANAVRPAPPPHRPTRTHTHSHARPPIHLTAVRHDLPGHSRGVP